MKRIIIIVLVMASVIIGVPVISLFILHSMPPTDIDPTVKISYLFGSKRYSLDNPVYHRDLDYSKTTICQSTMNCNSSTPEGCVKSWLIEAGCMSEQYRDKHFSDFRVTEKKSFNFPKNYKNDGYNELIVNADEKYFVEYNFIINGESPCFDTGSFNSCHAIVLKSKERLYLYSFSGPLREYDMKVTRQKAFNKLKNKITIRGGMNGLYLRCDDKFLFAPPNATYDPIGYEYILKSESDKGLYWRAYSNINEDGRNCSVKWIVTIEDGKIANEVPFCY